MGEREIARRGLEDFRREVSLSLSVLRNWNLVNLLRSKCEKNDEKEKKYFYFYLTLINFLIGMFFDQEGRIIIIYRLFISIRSLKINNCSEQIDWYN